MDHLAGVGRLLPGDDLAERGLPRPVAADEPGFLLAVERDGGLVEKDAGAVAFVDVFKLKDGRHSEGIPGSNR